MKRFLKISASLLFCVLVTVYAASVLKRTETASKYSTYQKRADECDVLFFGSSHVLNAVFPMQLWNDFGITSYNLAYHAFSIADDVELLNLAIQKSKPKIAVIDILSVDQNSQGSIAAAHNAFDAFPLSGQKIKSVCTLYSDFSSRAELLFPFLLYHDRWTELSFKDVLAFPFRKLPVDKTNGADLRIGVSENEDFSGMRNVAPYTDEGSYALSQLFRFISICKDNGIVPVIMYVPYPDSSYLDEWRLRIVSMLHDEGIYFLDMSDGVVDFSIDIYDLNSHVNPSGARKVTSCIGEFLKNQNLVQSHKEDEKYSNWERYYKDYQSYYFERLEAETDFKNFLMLLNFSDVRAELFAGEGLTFDEVEQTLLYKNTNSESITVQEKSSFADDINVLVFCRENGELLFTKSFKKQFVQITE